MSEEVAFMATTSHGFHSEAQHRGGEESRVQQRLLRRSAPRNDRAKVIASAAKQSHRVNESQPVKTFAVIY
jgi:hypothetical protein